MKVCLWDTRKNDVQKDFAGGMGVGMPTGAGGKRSKFIRHMYKRDFRPTALNFAYLAAVLKQLGQEVHYSLDDIEPADVYIFNPALLTLDLEMKTIEKISSLYPQSKILIVGQVAYAMADTIAEVQADNVTVIKGEPEQLLFKWDEVLQTSDRVVDVGVVADLDSLPMPDWSLFKYKKFRIHYDFWRFPSTFIQQSRGCTFKCNYCPYIMIESKTRFRSPELVAAEMQHGIDRYGFESFKFRDPLFGLNRKKALQLADEIGRLSKPVQFSIETRVDLMKKETLQALKAVGLTSITIGIETPDEDTLKKYDRVAINDDRQKDFVRMCRAMGIRTVAGFMVGFPEDTQQSIYDVLNYARKVNPTYANFNIVTPYPGTQFFNEVKDEIADFDFQKYSVYQPVMKYKHLTAAQVKELHGKCFSKFYFRSRYFKENGRLLWPQLNRFLPAAKSEIAVTAEKPQQRRSAA